MEKRKTKKISVLVLISYFIGLIFILNWSTQTHNLAKPISAFMINAEYLDSNGVVLQAKKYNCGPSALKMILDHYTIVSTIDEIEKDICLTEKGSSLLDLKTIAERKGLKVQGWRLTVDDFTKQPFPILLFVNDNHYIIADSVKNKEVYIRDPAIGRLKMSITTLSNIWKGEALLFSKN